MTMKPIQSIRNVPPHRRSLCGFTLVEIVCVVVVIGVLAAIAAPRLSNSIALRRVDSAARRIVMDLALARRQAMTGNKKQTVSFNPAKDKYELASMAHFDHPDLAYIVDIAEEPYGASLISVNFGGNKDIVFDMYGVPNNGGAIIIRVGALQRTIKVDPETGKAFTP